MLDSKSSVQQCTVGSNPTLSARNNKASADFPSEAFYTIKKPAPKIDAGFLLFLLHQALGDHPDRFAIGGDEVVHLGGDEVIVGLIGVSFEFLRVL